MFVTLTYRRVQTEDQTWRHVSKDFNRWIQKLRRLHNCNIHYLRTLENHQDLYPHIHALIQYPSAQIRIENSRYFDNQLYVKWRSTWKHGHSDFQVPRHSSLLSINYILKYITKNQTTKTIWKKIFKEQSARSAINQTSKLPTDSITDVNAETLVPVATKTTLSNTTKSVIRHALGAKLCTWSRSFNFSLFLPISQREPCHKTPSNTQKTTPAITNYLPK